MRVIAIIEVPECGKGKWYIDDKICYTENESLMKKFDEEMIPLKPMPSRKSNYESVMVGSFQMDLGYTLGWNDCLEELEKC